MTAADTRDQLELWLFDANTKVAERRLHAGSFGTSGELTELEKAQRERKRQFSVGVTEFAWHPDSARILVPSGW